MRSIKNMYAIAGSSAVALTLATAGIARAAAATGGTISNETTLNIAGGGGLTGGDFGAEFSGIANNALTIILLVSGVIAVFYLIYSGFQYLTAGGNDEKTKSARKGIINAVIGIIIIMAAFFLVRLVVSAGTSVTTGTTTL